MKNYVFDIDGTICTNTNGEYEKAQPINSIIRKINKLYDDGHTIKYFTARGSGTGINWENLTSNQLKEWGAKYHELILGKPEGDIYIDDKGVNVLDWDQLSYELNGKNENSKSIFNYLSKSEIAIKNLHQNMDLLNLLEKIGIDLQKCFKKGGKVIFAGNGGSFSDSLHISAEFTARLKNERNSLPSIVLGSNPSSMTAIGNDYGFEKIFSREFEGIAKSEDVLIALTTSGTSKNILDLIKKANNLSINYFVLTGSDGGDLPLNKNILRMPSEDTAITQQLHLIAGHLLCSIAEENFL